MPPPSASEHPEPEAESEISALIAMIDYLIPQAREISPIAVLHLFLAKEELQVEEGVRDNKIVRFRP